MWNIHLNSKSHKENITLAKKARTEPPGPSAISKPPQAFKRPSSPANGESSSSKKPKGILKNGAATNSALPADFFDNANKGKAAPKTETKKTEEVESEDVEMTEEKEDEKDQSQAPLPEGFFDDPIMDAKV